MSQTNQNSRLPTDQEWADWLQHPATLCLHRLCRAWQLQLKEQWASGAFTDQSQFGTAISNAKAIGNCEALDRVVEISYEQLLGELDDE